MANSGKGHRTYQPYLGTDTAASWYYGAPTARRNQQVQVRPYGRVHGRTRMQLIDWHMLEGKRFYPIPFLCFDKQILNLDTAVN
eukprot:SAG31_NODE_1003_length_10447_cov_3.491593_7_plen_84_part_00